MMQNLLEANDQTVEMVAETLGTHYFFCYQHDLSRLRKRLYDATEGTGVSIHTSYNVQKRTLRVTISR